MKEVDKIATGEDDITIDKLIEDEVAMYDVKDLALGHILYEAVRTMSPREFHDAHTRNLEGEKFDQIIMERAREVSQ